GHGTPRRAARGGERDLHAVGPRVPRAGVPATAAGDRRGPRRGRRGAARRGGRRARRRGDPLARPGRRHSLDAPRVGPRPGRRRRAAARPGRDEEQEHRHEPAAGDRNRPGRAVQGGAGLKIEGGRTHIVDTEIPEEHRVRSGAGYKLRRQAAFVELTTDEGITGYGPCSFGSASLDLGSVASLCDNTFAAALVGENPHRIEYLWDKIYYGSILRVHGNRSVGVAILSAIDIALWDIKGKALGVPVYELLGGAVRDPVPCYSSSVYWDTPEGAAEQARAFVDQGFKAFKVKVGLEVENDIASLHAIREEVGYGVDMLVDANQCYTRPLALRVGRELEKLAVPFFEEPLPIDDVDGHALLARKLDVRIATGENMYTRWHFLP